MKSSQQLEYDADRTRRQLESSLDELRARLTPGQLVDGMVDYARKGKAGDYFNNLGRQAVDNPLPIALMGAGMAWLLLSGDSRGPARESSHRAPALKAEGAASKTLGQKIVDGVEATVEATGDAVRRGAHDVSDSVSDAVDAGKSALRETASSVRGSTPAPGDLAASQVKNASEHVERSATQLADQARQSAQGLIAFCKEQPLVLAGIGLALGAAIGAVFPATQAENRLMGAASDNAKNKLSEITEDVSNSVANAAKSLDINGGAEGNGTSDASDGSEADPSQNGDARSHRELTTHAS